MEFPNLGKNCSEVTCNVLDFLPVECDGCHKVFCSSHMSYKSHNCSSPKLIDNQVPVCPLCGQPVPSKKGEPPDIAVGAHIDRDCQSDPAKNRRRIFTNKCSYQGCKKKELMAVVCENCKNNFCLGHRHIIDHNCQGMKKNMPMQNSRHPARGAGVDFSSFQGTLSEDEALAHALAMSMQESTNGRTQQFNGTSQGVMSINGRSNNCNIF